MMTPQPTSPDQLRFHSKGAGHTTKCWLLPDATLYDTQGSFHFHWAQHNADWLKTAKAIDLDPYRQCRDEDTVRCHLLQQGMIRLNHEARANRLTIEGKRSAFTAAAIAVLRELVHHHPEDIAAVRVHRFNEAMDVYDPDYVNFVGADGPRARWTLLQKHIPWLVAGSEMPVEPPEIPEPEPPRASVPAKVAPLIVHVPHASTVVPDSVQKDLLISGDDLSAELLRLTDFFTDELFAVPREVGQIARFPVSRLVVDPERFREDADEPMAQRGMGAVYTHCANGRPLRPTLTTEAREELLRRFYDPHQRRVTQLVERALEAHGYAVIIDAHSFPSRGLACHDYEGPVEDVFCLGTDPFHTPDWLVEFFRKELFFPEQCPVAVNAPFSGTFVPTAFYRKDPRVFSIMIEVNRASYLHEATGERHARFGSVRRKIRNALCGLHAALQSGEFPLPSAATPSPRVSKTAGGSQLAPSHNATDRKPSSSKTTCASLRGRRKSEDDRDGVLSGPSLGAKRIREIMDKMNERESERKEDPVVRLKLPPSERCVLCDRKIEEIGGRRIIAQQFRGVLLSKVYRGGGNKDYPHRSLKLSEESGLYVVVWGEKSKWTDAILEKARSEYLSGHHPWFCQICGVRGCRECGWPINYPMGSDTVFDDGSSSHCPIFPFDPGCINPDCVKYKKGR